MSSVSPPSFLPESLNQTIVMPRVSVIVPLFNAADTIAQTLDSIFTGGYANVEVVVVDDGSQDASDEVVARYQSLYTDRHILLTQHPDRRNCGASASRNLGVQYATGKYVAFLDADDLYRPNRFQISLRLLEEQPNLSAVFGTFLYEIATRSNENQIRDITSEIVNAVESQTLISPEEESFLLQLLRGKAGLHTSTITVRKEAFIKSGGFPHLKNGRRGRDFSNELLPQFCRTTPPKSNPQGQPCFARHKTSTVF